LLGNGGVSTFPTQHATIEELLEAMFSVGPLPRLATASSYLPDRQTFQSVLSCIVSGRYLSATSGQTENVCAVVVIYRMCKLVRLLEVFVVTSYKSSVNPVINPNHVSSH
jgi:hypothetical protein